jgi:hypothetical protein
VDHMGVDLLSGSYRPVTEPRNSSDSAMGPNSLFYALPVQVASGLSPTRF